MNRFYKARILFVSLNVLAMIFLCGCSGDEKDTDHDGVYDSVDKCPNIAGPKANNGCPVIPRIKNIHLYLDNSASMNGYYKDNTEYKTIITDMVAKMDKEISPVDISFIADNTVPYKKSIADFTNAIATTQIAAQKSSELQNMIGNISAHCDSNDVSLLVSDCILSFPNAAVKANCNINRDNAGSTLKNNIYATFVDLKNKGFGASIYGFRSKFYGIYYDFQNKKSKLKGCIRPFYVWVVARKPVLTIFDTKLEDISSFKPEKSLHFGLVDKPVNNYTILPELERKGSWSKSEAGISDVEISKTEPLQIGLVLNLQTLPSYVQNIDYLQNNLVTTINGCTAKFQFKKKSEIDQSKIHSENQIKTFGESSHILLISVTDMPLSQANIHFTLPLKYDTWYLNWSTMDDQTQANQENKTFAFEHLITGVKEAYETRNKNYVDFSLSLTK